jgi:hypothetical protein
MDIDNRIAQLGTLGAPDLSGLDGAALAQRARGEARNLRLLTNLAVVGALMIGLVSGVQSAPRSAASLVPFGAPPALTPLLQAGRG